MNASLFTRRGFLRRAAAGAAVLGMARWSVRSRARMLGANERIALGIIGCGGMGMYHLSELVKRREEKKDIEIVGVCDVYRKRKEEAGQRSGAQIYHHYRDLLAREDLDAVCIATPDHWHAQMALDAMRAGKDVYLEKPMTLTFAEAKEVARIAAQTQRVIQVGAQGSSEDQYWKARQAIAEGWLGKVVWSQASYSRNSKEGEWNWPIDPDASPETVDWNLWLGPAPKRPWDPDRFFRFRKYWDYSGGVVTDLLYHRLAELSTALGREFPHRVVCTGGLWVQTNDREVPDTVLMSVDYPSQHSVSLFSSTANEQGLPTLIRGHQATLHFGGNHIRIVADGPFKDDFQAQHDKTTLRIPTEQREDHWSNFLRCVRTRETPHLDAPSGYRVMTAIAMAVQSYRQNKMLFFDPARETITDRPPSRSGAAPSRPSATGYRAR